MPLTASFGDQAVLAPLLPSEAWRELKGHRPRPVLNCGATAIAKTSHRGTQFFAHKIRCDVEHKGETLQHLRIKAVIVRAAAALGRDARAEVRAPDGSWVADVLVEKGGRRVAFEVQIVSQNLERYRERQLRYGRDGVECFWITSRVNTDHLVGVPALRVDPNADELLVAHRSRVEERHPLDGFIASVLGGGLRWAPRAPATVTGSIRWGIHVCDLCGGASVVWDVDAAAAATCQGCAWRRPSVPLYAGHAPRAAAAHLGVDMPMTAWEGKDEAVPSRFRCPHCQAELPTRDLGWLVNGLASARSTAPISVDVFTDAHWCAPEFDLRRPADVVRWLRGERLAAPKPVSSSPL